RKDEPSSSRPPAVTRPTWRSSPARLTPAPPRLPTVAPRTEVTMSAGQLPDAWRAALRSRAVSAPRVPHSTLAEPMIERRRFLRAGFWTGVGLTLVGSAATALDFMWPRHVRGFGAPVPAGHVGDVPPGADPVPFRDGQFWLVHLDPDDRSESG